MTNILEFNNVSFSYSEKEEGALENLDFSIKKGEFILLTGKSGSGKNTNRYCP